MSVLRMARTRARGGARARVSPRRVDSVFTHARMQVRQYPSAHHISIISISAHTYTCVYIYIYIYMYLSLSLYTYIYTHIQVSHHDLKLETFQVVRDRRNGQLCMYVYIYIYIYIHISNKQYIIICISITYIYIYT